jgi:hypothetical protein
MPWQIPGKTSLSLRLGAVAADVAVIKNPFLFGHFVITIPRFPLAA